jgi:ATP-dependent helicase Lhr and Lhr-like helicase
MKRFPPFHDRYPAELVGWVEDRGWPSFTEIQQEAIKSLPINAKTPLPDAILEAETSSGKTEAAFLPLLARVAPSVRPGQRGFSILYVSPLKALINDQEVRLRSLANVVGLNVHPWHADVETRRKDEARRARSGILLTTPESIEGFFVRAGQEYSRVLLTRTR